MSEFRRGLKAGIPIGVGYFSVSFTMGLTFVTMGLTWWEAMALSFLTMTSAGQVSAVQQMVAGSGVLSLLVSQLTINARYMFMSLSMSQKINKRFTKLYRWLLSFFMTDEIFAVASGETSLDPGYFWGLALLPWIGWTSGTAMGGLLGSVLPEFILDVLGLALYGMFIAIVVPEAVKKRQVVVVVLISLVLSVIFYSVPGLKDISKGLTVSICAVIASVVGALLFPVKEEKNNEN